MLRQCRRQTRVDAERIAAEIETGEAEHHRLPQPAQAGDADAAGAVRIEFEVGGRGLAQIAKRHVGVSPSRAATSACMPALSELPCAQRGS